MFRHTLPLLSIQLCVLIAGTDNVSGQTIINTYYNTDNSIAYGVTTDAVLYRDCNDILTDNSYVPVMPDIPAELTVTGKSLSKSDPQQDKNRSIFSSAAYHQPCSSGFDNASDRKEILAIELFGYAGNNPAELAGKLRKSAASGATARGRHTVLDAQSVIGGQYQNEAVCYGGKTGSLTPTPRLAALYSKGVRYVLSGAVADYRTHSYLATKDSKHSTYESLITLFITAYDLDARTLLPTYWFNLKGTGASQNKADDNAVKGLESYVSGYISDNLPITATITELGESNKKGKIKTCVINTATGVNIARTDVFKVYRTDDRNPDNTIGKVKVTSTGTGGAVCTITGGQDEIVRNFQNGVELILLSAGQTLF